MSDDSMTWGRHLSADRANLFSEAFLDRWATEIWNPDISDRAAAAALHIQLVSRITTQPLGYSEGDEATALKSLYELFGIARDICTKYPMSSHFDALTWHVLNTHVRPLTAKWHRRAEAGALAALDGSDEFRAELDILRPKLAAFDDLMLELRDGRPPPPRPKPVEGRAIATEMQTELAWGTSVRGGIDDADATRIDQAEREAIEKRRTYYGIGAKPHAVGMALSGGGIRSAIFSLGVLVALARRNILPQVDYLSTVSGGGYIGSFLTAFLNGDASSAATPAPEIGLRSSDLPFRRREGEAAALRTIRHRSRYLTAGSLGELLSIAAAQLQGLFVNALLLVTLAAAAALVERGIRVATAPLPHMASWLALFVALMALLLLPLSRIFALRPSTMDRILGWGLGAWATALVWQVLGALHGFYTASSAKLAIVGVIPAAASLAVVLLGRRLLPVRLLLVGVAALAAPLFVVMLELAVYDFVTGNSGGASWETEWDHVAVLTGVLIAALVLAFVDVNQTSPHRSYRDKLARAFLIRPGSEAGFVEGGSLKLSHAAMSGRAPYHLVNCALNVPASRTPRMQGRLTDFFMFSPAYTGSPLTRYAPTTAWEAAMPGLNIATAMAISGAAAAPQMGLATNRNLRFWLALLNVRLGQWIRVPLELKEQKGLWTRLSAPGLTYLLREMTGRIDETHAFVNVTDGGHIENLGVYELLRRRCKFIIAVDGEQDPEMTFGALTNLQRLAGIDFGITIEIDLDDLRLNSRGLSRSHFRFCRIRYPEGTNGSGSGIGYLLYVKLSLTGNEGEFIRRYRLDQPAFPHHPTADQFFTEAQFEAYRSLGEHVGDKLFLRAIIGPLADSDQVNVEAWFAAIGTSML